METYPQERNILRLMKQRCLNVKNKDYKYYGGRGILVCERWLSSFRNFLEDMGERPSENHSIDRLNNDKGYYKENCRWATRSQQQRNKGMMSNNKSGVKGVHLNKNSGKFEASISVSNKRIYLGSFFDIKSAVKARKDGEEKYWG
jgi:hypothetical protein